MANGDFWSGDIWAKFNGVPGDATKPGLLNTTMGPMQIAQHVFKTVITGSDAPISADVVDLHTGLPTSGRMRAFATLRKAFRLLPMHVVDPTLMVAANQVSLAGQAIAMTSDALFFRGREANLAHGVTLFPGDQDKLDKGLLGIAEGHKVISVHPEKNKRYGLATYSAVVEGISHFTTDAQGQPYGLILSPDVFADANLPLEDSALVTPANAIQPLLAAGPFVMSPGMPPKTGLLASMGASATTLYVGSGPLLEFNNFEDSVYSFTARESIQFVEIDARALIKLEFEESAKP
jgi:Encapsulating protein for peroxidase